MKDDPDRVPTRAPGGRWLRLAVIGWVLMAGGSLGLVGVHVQTRAAMREVLIDTKGLIRTDDQMQVLNEIMTRGLLLSIGGLGLVLLGILLSVVGLVAFFGARRRWAVRSRTTGGEAINGP